MFEYPWGNSQALNLGWFLSKFKELVEEWNDKEESIDGALDAEIQKAEDALEDVFTARDVTVAAKNDALQAKADALTAAANAAQYWQNAANSAQSAATSAVTALQAAQDADADAQQTASDRASVTADKATVAADKAAVAADKVTVAQDKAAVAADKVTVAQDKADTDLLKDAANAAALRSEGYAVGKQNGTPVTSESPYYQNNAEYYKDLAEAAATENSESITDLDYEVFRKVDADIPIFATGIDNTVLVGLYFPNLASGWMIERLRARSTMFRLGIKLADNTLIINGLSDVGTSYSDTVQTFVNPSTGEILGYYVLHYKGEDYDADDKYPTSDALSLDNNYIINEYLNRKENLVLIGDSVFGYESENLLAPILRKLSNKKIFNCAFGGCTMAKTGTTPYNPLTFAGIAESINSGDFSSQQGAIGLMNIYPYRYAELAAVDWSKPTTIFVNYVNNDLTAAVPLGDPWAYTESSSDWDNTKFVEAMTYGLNKILSAYPHIKVVFFTSKWRFIANSSNVLVPPYVYENSLNLKAKDYNDALIENANRLGVSVYDFHDLGGSNAFNASYMMIDGKSHFTIEGYEHFAEVLNSLDKSFIG